MKAVRIAALGAALLISAAAAASAQAQQGGQMGGRRGLQMNGIELTDAQKVKLEEIQRKYHPKMMELRQEFMNGGDRAELMKKSNALREQSAADIRAILTPDQQAVWDKNMVELKAKVEQAQKQAPPL